MNREFSFTDDDFRRIQALAQSCAGIALGDSKRDLAYSRLAKRLRANGLDCFDRYCDLLETQDTAEIGEFINAITTNLTAFFRESHHFEYLGKTLLPSLMTAKRGERRLRIWSAGCSTGEEPYSIAMVLKECLDGSPGWDARILATDLDTNVLETARAGIYGAERLKGVPAALARRWFQSGTGANDGYVRVRSELRDMIRFRQLNLMQPWPVRGPFDAIFCRNVVIYFSKETQRALFDRFADLVHEQGCLFVGHSESLYKVTNRFELIGKTIYRRAM